jgi:CRISPR/Cas system-associated exonuclease Cas4 (RecB family)
VSTSDIAFDAATHTYTVNGCRVPSVTQILKAFDRGLDAIEPDVLERKSRLGSAVHRACELDDDGLLDEASVHPLVRPYLAQWRAFRCDMAVEVIDNEHIVYNKLHNYIGTNDRLLRFSKYKRAVGEVKSGAKRAWHPLQTGGYAAAAETYDQPVDGRFCLYLTPNNYRLVPHEDPRDKAVFLNAVALYHWMKRQGIVHE